MGVAGGSAAGDGWEEFDRLAAIDDRVHLLGQELRAATVDEEVDVSIEFPVLVEHFLTKLRIGVDDRRQNLNERALFGKRKLDVLLSYDLP